MRYVPTPGIQDKVFIVPMMHPRLISPQGCLEDVTAESEDVTAELQPNILNARFGAL